MNDIPMTISTKMAVMSHLSDAQELMDMNRLAESNLHINFAKRLLSKYPNDTEVEEKELDALWFEVVRRFSR